MAKYHFRIKTGDEVYAGTDSNIFLILFGESGQTSEKRLNGYIHGDAFERNSVNTFDISDWEAVGQIYKIKIRSDTHYSGSDWLLSYIEVIPLEPPNPLARFNFDEWIKNATPRERLASGWAVTYEGIEYVSQVARTITAIDLLDAGQLQQEYTVKYTLANQVELSTEIKDSSHLSLDVKWESPSKVLGQDVGKITTDLKEEWQTETDNKRIDKTSWQLEVTDKRTITFPAGRLTMIQADWTESWTRSLARLGSTAMGMQWINVVPTNPGWTIKSFSKGDAIPEPFASYVRDHHPELIPYFILAPATPQPGVQYRVTAKHSGRCLDVSGAELGNGARIQQWDWLGGANQKWLFDSVGGDMYRITAVHSGKVLDVGGPGDHTATGAGVQQWDWCNGNNQKWRLRPLDDGAFAVTAVHSGKVLDVGGPDDHKANGCPVNQWDWCNGDNQKWFIEKA